MAAAQSTGTSTCKYCGPSRPNIHHQYLDIHPLCLHELPVHEDLADGRTGHVRTLAEFLNAVLAEAYQFELEGDAWTFHGRYPQDKIQLSVSMPGKSSGSPDVSVPIRVEQRVKGADSSSWLARRSDHQEQHVSYAELDTLLSQDHCRKEGQYDPSVFDANELIQWNEQDLQNAVSELKPEWQIDGVQMSLYQMFHEMPKALGMNMLQNRVFHVLCVTAHSTYDAPSGDEAGPLRQSYTLQLPIAFDSLKDIAAVNDRSHIKPKSQKYEFRSQNGARISDERQKKSQGKSLTEGVYVSLERLRQAPRGSNENAHRWDMATKSDAKGISKAAPWGTKKKETLQAISKDVSYVFEQIKKQRQVQK